MASVKIFRGHHAFRNVIRDTEKTMLRAGANTVNITAFRARKKAIENIQRNFITRNTFTARHVLVDQCPKGVRRIDDIKATTGAVREIAYMERQEYGGIHTPERGNKLAIPTNAARSGNAFRGSVRRQYKMSDMQKVRGPFSKSGTRRSRSVARAAVAAKTGKLINYGGNLHRVTRFKRNGASVSFILKMIRNFKFSNTTTKPRPWLRPASDYAAEDMQRIYNSEMDKL